MLNIATSFDSITNWKDRAKMYIETYITSRSNYTLKTKNARAGYINKFIDWLTERQEYEGEFSIH